jgi:hypothetical protein
MLFVNNEDQVEDFVQTNLCKHLPAREELGVRAFQSSIFYSHLRTIKPLKNAPP